MQTVLNIDLDFEISQNDGHIFFIPSHYSANSLISELERLGLLIESQILVMKAVARMEYKFVTVKQIEQFLPNSRGSINKIINRLVTLSILNNTEFKFDSGIKLPKTKCLSFPEKTNFASLLSQLESIKKDKKVNQSKTLIGSAKQTAISQYELPELVKDNSVERGYFPSKLPPFERIVPNKDYKSHNHVSVIFLQGRKVIVEAKSANRIMNGDDIKTLYTLMTLSINQQANMINYYKVKGCAPQNSHYIEIRHIMKVLGKSSAGSYYDAFVNSILRIKDTIFDLHQLEAMYENGQGEKIFVGQDFRFFESCQPLSKTGPVIISDDKDNSKTVKIKPFGFMISWHTSLFTKMLTDKYFFVIPLKILAAPTIIFLFYMLLRNHFSFDRNKVWELTIDGLHNKLNSSTQLYNFKRDFISGLNTWNEGGKKLSSNSEQTIDIQGFMVTIEIANDVVIKLSCQLDIQKMLSYAGVKSDNNGLTSQQTTASPTAPNTVVDLLPILNFRKNRGNEYPQESNMRLLLNSDRLLKGISINKISKYAYTVETNSFKQRVTAYTDDAEILFISEYLHKEQLDQSAFFSHLKSLHNKLELLSSGVSTDKQALSIEQFNYILKGLVTSHAMILEKNELYDLLLGKGQVISVACDWDQEVDNTPILNKLNSLYKGSV